MITIDQAEVMLDELANELPPDFFVGLNGGICLLPEIKRHPESVGDNLYILGQYHRDAMGRYITIFFGSFEVLYGRLPPAQFKERLRKTLLHEFTHHMEYRAGLRGLEVKDEQQLAEYQRRQRRD